VLDLLSSPLDTLEKVEAAWHLHRAGRPLTSTELLELCQSTLEILTSSLVELTASDIVRRGSSADSFVLGPRAKQPDFEMLMELYGHDRLVVISTLAANAMGRIRSMAARTFSDLAPRRRRPDEDDDE
jgi:hypothetical protein